MYRLYRKMTMNGHFSIQSIHFEVAIIIHFAAYTVFSGP